ncbi:Di-trans-poly-cis-decaprenylcistransferase [Metschnikowia bicuspidata var. bicuspidata NRRL YB-4993]|uniref:Alkyl transferase n=1 Tax=Metschnikowia bicuspidata var. bicuspidata NRRL YB-4993 TaxID=869754 RepID=A0A1A0HG18_9ASCO|nr:Di-trans-poly-cis-decaprenylcistransferase [Metschnikowia bicuspidata var. bicuspidata NRRL YB-4993]OBA22946.1 Di-trans-poly-cis-decaprenylcistransferase [Metschnikowia bicuspidata var. bicuspidata NRRL YB-4993]
MPEWISTFPGYSQLMRKIKCTIGGVCKTGPVPRHVGVIMDGNRRYAKTNKIEMKEGHNLGFDSMASILELLYESGVACATVYAFSIENFKRLRYEVEWLMNLAKSKLYQMSQHGELCDQYGIRIKILGNVSLLPADVQKILQDTQKMTAHNTRAVLNVCFPYTSRDEIAHSIRGVVKASMEDPEMIIDEHTMENYLYTADAPPLDLLIRTSGTSRLSDFLLWQSVPSTCAIVFSDRLWPEFLPWDMTKILLSWSFNMYWYGHGNGQTMSKIVLHSSALPSLKNHDASLFADSDVSTAYERYTTESPVDATERLSLATGRD